MTLASLIMTLIVVGIVLWCINSFIPMEARIKNILNVVVIIFVIVWILQATSMIGRLGNVRIR